MYFATGVPASHGKEEAWHSVLEVFHTSYIRWTWGGGDGRPAVMLAQARCMLRRVYCNREYESQRLMFTVVFERDGMGPRYGNCGEQHLFTLEWREIARSIYHACRQWIRR